MKKIHTKTVLPADPAQPEHPQDSLQGSAGAQVAIIPIFLLYLVILTEGFVTISLEILTLRQLIPFVGNSVTVTSLVIGVFLLFLAYGYLHGGKIEQNPLTVLTRNFCIAAILLGIGLSYAFIDLFFLGFKTKISSNLLSGLLVYLLCITAPLVYVLGQTVPITMHLHTKSKKIGLIGGKVLHASTIGSFLGSILTTVILMRYFGVAQTVYINFCLLTLLVFILSLLNGFRFAPIILLMTFSVIIFKLNVQFESMAFIKTNTFGNYAIEPTNKFYHTQGKVLIINNSASSYINEQNKGFPYIELIKNILFNDLKLKNKQILILGAGGFTLSAEQPNDNQFTYIDIDPDLPKITKEHFLKNSFGNIVIQDARQYLLIHPKQYDVIVSDTYSHQLSVPTHLMTKEYFQLIALRMKPTGVAIFNIVANPMLNDLYSKRIDNTLRSVFSSCMAIPHQYHNGKTNIIYACRKDSVDRTVYIDNNNKGDFDIFNLQ